MKPYLTGQGVWQASLTRNGKRITFYLGKRIDYREAHRMSKILTILVDVPQNTWQLDHGESYFSLPERVRESLQRHFDFCRPTDMENLFGRHYATILQLKESTRRRYRNWYEHLGSYFDNISVSKITQVEAESFRAWCVRELGHSEATVSRGIRTCCTIFDYVVSLGILKQNPFKQVKTGSEVNLERMYYVDRLKFERILSQCCQDRDRLLFSLARYCGLRIPSEVRKLRYGDLTDMVIRVNSDTKTGFREVPMLSEVKGLVAGLRGDPAELVFSKSLLSRRRERLQRAILAAGFDSWPKLFINLRSSCITDYVAMGYGDKVLDSMFGNSSRVREVHYVQFRKESEHRRMLIENRELVEHLRKRMESNEGGSLEPLDLCDFVLAQRIAKRSNV